MAVPAPVIAAQPSPVTSQSALTHAEQSVIAQAEGAVVAAVTPGGTWTWQNPSPNANALDTITCPTPLVCIAAGDNGPVRATTDGGAHWTNQQVEVGVLSLGCGDASFCVGVTINAGEITTSNGGATWTSGPTNFGQLYGVSCLPGTHTCFGVGGGGLIVELSGPSVGQRPSGTSQVLFGINCTSPLGNVCVAVGSNGTVVWSTNGGSSFTPLTPATSQFLITVSCGATVCAAAGISGTVATWTISQPTPKLGRLGATPDIYGSSCLGTTCLLTGIDGHAFIGFDQAWGPTDVGEPGALWSVSCVSETTCFVAGSAGVIAETTNAGTGWRVQSPNALGTLTSVSCPSTSVCLAAGSSTLLKTADGGSTWSDITQVAMGGAADSFSGVSCPSTSVCYVVGAPNPNGNGPGGLVAKTIDGGATWTSTTLAAPLNTVSCPTTTVCFAGVGLGGQIFATTNGTNWSAQSTPTTDGIFGISCTSTTNCMAVTYHGNGSFILATTNGTSWSTILTTSNTLFGITCSSSTTCYAVGNDTTSNAIQTTTDGGGHWTESNPANPGGGTIYSVSCTSLTTCYAVGGGGGIWGTTDGVTWTPQPSPNGYWYSVSCAAGTASCVVVAYTPGRIARTVNAGAAWFLVAPSGGSDSFRSVSCPSATVCFATGSAFGLGADIFATSNGGVSWLQVFTQGGTFADPAELLDIACTSMSICYALDNHRSTGIVSVVKTVDGGATWSSVPLPFHNYLQAVSCPDASNCFVVYGDGGFLKTTDGFASVSPLIQVTPNGFTGISCPTSALCFATDGVAPGHVWASFNGGASWAISFDLASDSQAGSLGNFTSISCASANMCSAGGVGGLIATTTDGGNNWHTDNVSLRSNVTHLSCPSEDTCFASTDASAILRSTDWGGDWLAQFGGNDRASCGGGCLGLFGGISCPSTTQCFAVGAGALITATTNGGAAWNREQPTGQVTYLNNISCTDANNCYASAFGFTGLSGIQVTHDGGATWSYHTLNKADTVDSISCPAANTCFASGWPGAIYSSADGGATWTYQTNALSGSDQSLLGISCASATTCYAVGTTGHILATTDGGVTWMQEASHTVQHLFAVSCTSSSTCEAVGSGGVTVARTAAGWQVHPSGTTQTLAGVSCPTTSKCFAVGRSGTVLVTNDQGGTWSAQASGVTRDLLDIQCTSGTGCLAAGSGGTVVYTIDGTTWGSINVPTTNPFSGVAFLSPGVAYLVGFGGTILQNSNLFSLCLTTTMSSDKTSPQYISSTVTFTGSSPGGCHAQFQFWVLPPGGTWNVVRAYSATPTYVWNTTGLAAGTYTIGLWSRDNASTNAFDSYTSMTFTLQAFTCTSAGVSALPAPPVDPVTQVTFTATSTGCPNARYEFWMRPATSSTWQIVQPYSSSTTFQWSSTYTSFVGVWAKDASSSTSTFDANASMTMSVNQVGCQNSIIGAAPNKVTVGSGTKSTITASDICTNANPLFEFWVRAAGSTTWVLQQPYSTTATYDWDSTGSPVGTVYIGVWVKDAKSPTATFDANAATSVTVSPPYCTSVTAVANPTSVPHGSGTHSTITATAAGCTNPGTLYEFWVRAAGSTTWVLTKTYSTSNTFDWDSTGSPIGTVYIGIWVKDAASPTSTFDANAAVIVTVT